MVLLRISHSAVRQHGALTRLVCSLGGQELCGVSILAGLVAVIVQPGGLVDHQPCGLKLHPAGGQRMLHGLVLADGPAKNMSLAGVERGAPQRGIPDADGLGGDEDALGVHAVHDHLEAVVFLADEICRGDAPAVEEQAVGVDGRAAHLGDLADLHLRPVQVRVEQAEPLAGLGDLVERRRARQDQDLLRHLRRRDPDLLPAEQVVVARLVLDGPGLQFQRVEARVRLRNAEARPVLARDQRHQHAALLLVRPKLPHRLQPENVHVHRAGTRVRRPALRNRLHHHRRLRDPQLTAPVLARHADAQPPVFGDCPVEFHREPVLLFRGSPVCVGELRTYLADGFADRALRLR